MSLYASISDLRSTSHGCKALSKTKATFINPCCFSKLSDCQREAGGAYELKQDGYRALAIKTGGKVHLRSRNDDDFNFRYPAVVKALGRCQMRRSLMAR
jgi:ATP-dependent DNA ligase